MTRIRGIVGVLLRLDLVLIHCITYDQREGVTPVNKSQKVTDLQSKQNFFAIINGDLISSKMLGRNVKIQLDLV